MTEEADEAVNDTREGSPWWKSRCMTYSSKRACNESADAVCTFDTHHKVCFPKSLSPLRRNALTRLIRGEREAVQQYVKHAKQMTIDQWLALNCWQATNKDTCDARTGCYFHAAKRECLPEETKTHRGYLRDTEELRTYLQEAESQRVANNITDMLDTAAPLRFRILGALAQSASWVSLGVGTNIIRLLQSQIRHQSMTFDSWWSTIRTISTAVWALVQRYRVLGVAQFLEDQVKVLRMPAFGAIGTMLATHVAMVHASHLADNTITDVAAFVKACVQSFRKTTAPKAREFRKRRAILRTAHTKARKRVKELTRARQVLANKAEHATGMSRERLAELYKQQAQIKLWRATAKATMERTKRKLLALNREFLGPLLRSALVFGATSAIAVAIHSTGYANVMVLVVQTIFACAMYAVRQVSHAKDDIMTKFLHIISAKALDMLRRVFDAVLTS